MISEECSQVLQTLKQGLRNIETKREKAKGYSDRLRLKSEIKIQEAKIKFFKKGYGFHEREIKEQTKLGVGG